MNNIKSRKVKESLYQEKYKDIPLDYTERLSYMYDKYKLSDKKMQEIIDKKNYFLYNLYYNTITIVLYEEPEGSPRPRFRIVNRHNLYNEAINNSNFVHVYSLTGKEDNIYMKRLLDDELIQAQTMIYTPCIVEYTAYFKTPSYYNVVDTFLAEIGIERQISKPDWDNVGKKYSDMMNRNIWLDDNFAISGTVHKYYSILPRIEIKLSFLNMVYNKYQYNNIIKRPDYKEEYNLKHPGNYNMEEK